jgi:eukaryotic-like serine/threonine-protein kinase
MKDLLNGFLEWTRDSQTAYPGSTKVKPDTGLRIFRGRPEDHPEEEKTFRFPQKPDFTYELLGFRIVQEAGGGGQ